jgi:hypothetical protein
MFLHGSLCLELQLDVSSSFPSCIGPSRTSKIVKTSSKNCTMVQYLAPLGYSKDHRNVFDAEYKHNLHIDHSGCRQVLLYSIKMKNRETKKKKTLSPWGTCNVSPHAFFARTIAVASTEPSVKQQTGRQGGSDSEASQRSTATFRAELETRNKPCTQAGKMSNRWMMCSQGEMDYQIIASRK